MITLTTAGILLDAQGYVQATGLVATLEYAILTIGNTPYPLREMSILPDRIESRGAGWTLLLK